jgi:hypothetical protein
VFFIPIKEIKIIITGSELEIDRYFEFLRHIPHNLDEIRISYPQDVKELELAKPV